MMIGRTSERFRIFAIMGILLVLTFAVVNLSGTIDQFQHVHGSTPHEHILLSEVTAEHVDDSTPDIHGQTDGSADHMPGHHHQGDNGHSMIAQVPTAITAILSTSTQGQAARASFRVGLAAASLERPPKNLTASA